MSTELMELDVPPAVFDAEWNTELLRFWVADGEDHLSLRIDAVGSSEGDKHGAEIRGSILADISRHIVNAYQQSEMGKHTNEQLFALIEKGFAERLKERADYSGQLIGDGNAH